MKWRNLLLKIHSYLGLFCAPYLLIFGITSLHFNHGFLSNDRTEKNTVTYENVAFDPEQEPKELVTSIAKELGLMGWFIPWETWEKDGILHSAVTHTGLSYNFRINLSTHKVEITRFYKSQRELLYGLHALGESIPRGTWWINTWKQYQTLTVYSLVFWVITGIYFWLTSKTRSSWEFLVFIGFVSLSLFVLLFAWFHG